MSEWISVKDRLPEPYVAVLVWEKDDTKEGGFAYVDRHDGEAWEIGSMGNGAVTHWMPLPEPPEPEVTEDTAERYMMDRGLMEEDEV